MAFLLPLAPYGASAVGGFLIGCVYQSLATNSSSTSTTASVAASNTDSIGVADKQADSEKSNNNCEISDLVVVDIPEAPAPTPLPAPLLHSILKGVTLRPTQHLTTVRDAGLRLTPHEQLLKQLVSQPVALKRSSSEINNAERGGERQHQSEMLEFQKMRGRLRPTTTGRIIGKLQEC
jgi:hypothetical protein